VKRADLVNCPRCGRLSATLVRGQCGECLRQEHAQLRRVQALLADRGALPAEEIAAEVGVPVERVLRWLRDGRLFATGETVRCRRCGRPVRFGVVCAPCRVELAVALRALQKGLRSAAPQAPAVRRRRVRREAPKGRFDLW